MILLFRLVRILYHTRTYTSIFPVNFCGKEVVFIANALLIYVYIDIKIEECLYV